MVNQRPFGACLPEDGKTVGELQLRGAWITGNYLNADSDAFAADGWLRTGDVGVIDAKGYVQLTDRTKDVIKSGGEWISSVDLEDVLLKSADVAEVAVIAIPDARWQERPLAVIVLASGEDEIAAIGRLRHFLGDKVAKFWVPEYWCFISEIPKTSVGKMDKKVLRAMLEDNQLTITQYGNKGGGNG